MTCVAGPNVISDVVIYLKAIVDKEFVARLDGSERANEHTIARFYRLAVGGTAWLRK